MWIQKLYDKLITEPKRKRDRIGPGFRAGYDYAPKENTLIYYILGGLFTVVIFTLYIYGFIEAMKLNSIIVIIVALICIYIFKPRNCKKCSQRMIRQRYDGILYYFCDNCKLKIRTPSEITED